MSVRDPALVRQRVGDLGDFGGYQIEIIAHRAVAVHDPHLAAAEPAQ